MAGDWIPIRVDIDDDPAVVAMAQKLNIDEKTVVGGLVKFWGWASRHTRDGNAASVTELWLDRFIGCAGWCAAMVSVGWLERVGGKNWLEGGGFSIPRFDRWNAQTAKSRSLTRERVAKFRAKHKANGCNAVVTQNVTPTEQKRIEEKRKKKGKAIAPALPKPTNLESTEIFGAFDRSADTGDPHGPDLSEAEQRVRAIHLNVSNGNVERSEADPLEQAMVRLKGGNPALVGGTMRRKCCEAANEYGEDRVIAALNWASANGQPYGDALALARRKSWNAADVAAGPAPKPDGNYERNLKIMREVAEREASEAAMREAEAGR